MALKTLQSRIDAAEHGKGRCVNERFYSDLTGRKWWKTFLSMIALIAACVCVIEFSVFWLDFGTKPGLAAVSIFFSLVVFTFATTVEAAFTTILLRIAVPTVIYREKGFSFSGELRPVMRIAVTGAALTLLTAGLYEPWFMRRYVSYLVAQIEYDSERPRFLGKGRKLFKYGILALVPPLLTIIALYLAVLRLMTGTTPAVGPGHTMAMLTLALLFSIVLFFALIPYFYLRHRWHFNISWKGRLLSWHTEFWPSVLFIAKQLAITVITFGIYWPAFAIKCYRYFAGKTVIAEDAKNLGHFTFDSRIGRGFLLIWGQALLTILTLGIFAPWAYATIIRYFINGTVFVTE